MLDQALEYLGGFGPDLRNGMTTHAPMVSEALCALGRPDAVMPWLERYAAQALPRPPARERIERAGFRAALAREERFSDWSAFFADELANAKWRELLDAWVARLAPGICAAATHGVIRVGHAARALGELETPARLRELADALASWASTYQELPTTRRRVAGSFRPREAIARVALQPREQRVFAGTIVSSLAGLERFPEFAGVIGLLDTAFEPSDLVAELTEVFARVLVENARDALTAIVLTHGVTSIAALGNLLPHVRETTARAALPYAWQASCGLYATFGSAPAPPRAFVSAGGHASELAERAIAHGDEHAIKLAEACLAAHARSPSPVLLEAPRRVLELLPPG
jgi:hypothetical protein